jgi:hypothetical protein
LSRLLSETFRKSTVFETTLVWHFLRRLTRLGRPHSVGKRQSLSCGGVHDRRRKLQLAKPLRCRPRQIPAWDCFPWMHPIDGATQPFSALQGHVRCELRTNRPWSPRSPASWHRTRPPERAGMTPFPPSVAIRHSFRQMVVVIISTARSLLLRMSDRGKSACDSFVRRSISPPHVNACC